MTSGTVEGLVRLDESGWRRGLSTLMRAGFASWWRTRTWWIQALLWTAVINGALAAMIWGDAPEGPSVFSLFGVMTMFAAIAVAIVMQDAIVGEKRSGTAAWVLSKPTSRPAFMLSKLVPNAVGTTATMLAIPAVVMYLQVSLAGIEVSPLRFALGTAVAALNLMFYLTLTLMLGTLVASAGAVIAAPLAFAFGQQLLGSSISAVLPWALVVPVGESDVSVVGALIDGTPLDSVAPIVVTAAACIVFTVVAFWRWNRTEL
ncbi:ABC transporter permease subunit [Demequina sp. SYSU T00039]|uniref:ABC transporter permease subunit n=1 Tax=Demequina lignilytica TaxID=3051663 RepID=A0AAW7LZE9_9MICO|nr:MULTISPECIES: ABC transporter permease subunit [unclassified Demequina]MDN4486589.1 ABC transporter permease subunit [Demequina sp. SYSU T00039]MDN4489275.1 ABC transporter permease subunit [Demequina sp. SYSU T00068]